MSKQEKRIANLLDKSKPITFDEMKSLLEALGFDLDTGGKTSGSRVIFFRKKDQAIIRIHKPHPGKELKNYQREDVIAILKDKGDLK